MSAPTSPEHRRHVIEDVIWLTDNSESAEMVARHLNYRDAATLADVLTKWGEPSVARRMRTGQVAA